MKRGENITVAVAALLSAAVGTAYADVPTPIKGNPANSVYVLDQRGYVVRSGTGLCWRDGYFSKDLALADCDAGPETLG